MLADWNSEAENHPKRTSEKLTAKTVHDLGAKARKTVVDDEAPMPTVVSSSISKSLSFAVIAKEEAVDTPNAPIYTATSFMLDLRSLLSGSSSGLLALRNPRTVSTSSESEGKETLQVSDEDGVFPEKADSAPPGPEASMEALGTSATVTPVLRETPSELSSLIKEVEGQQEIEVVKEPLQAKREEDKLARREEYKLARREEYKLARREEDKQTKQKSRVHKTCER